MHVLVEPEADRLLPLHVRVLHVLGPARRSAYGIAEVLRRVVCKFWTAPYTVYELTCSCWLGHGAGARLPPGVDDRYRFDALMGFREYQRIHLLTAFRIGTW